jgi:hypothetical protein
MKIAMRAAPLFLSIAVLTTGCSSFDRAWRNPPAQTAGIGGRWEGRQQSAQWARRQASRNHNTANRRAIRRAVSRHIPFRAVG